MSPSASISGRRISPVSSAVIYGQPNEGVVVVRVTEEKKKDTKAILDEMAKA